MDRTVTLIPLAQNGVFFNYAYINDFTTRITRHIKGMIQQFFPDPIVSIFGQHRKVIQFTLFIVLHEQRIVSAQCPVFFKDIHSSILIVHLPI